jgi:hypothetical protein
MFLDWMKDSVMVRGERNMSVEDGNVTEENLWCMEISSEKRKVGRIERRDEFRELRCYLQGLPLCPTPFQT